jgi:signal transduction histidine kinase
MQALLIAQNSGLKKLEAEIYYELVDLLKSEGKYSQALEYSDLRQKLLDSISNIEKIKEIANLQAMYELEKSNEKVKALTSLIHKNTIKRDIIIIIALINLVILIILAFSYKKTIGLNKQITTRSEDLTEANNIKDKLFSIIGHDLRGPIGNIPVLLDLYVDEDTPPEEKQFFFDSIKELAASCKDTLDKMLFWGKSNIKGIHINQQVFEPKGNIVSCLKLVRAGATQKNITLIDNTTAGLKIFADIEHFEFVVRNLLSNSIKFTFKNGKVEISADATQLDGFVVFAVKDTGSKGIPATTIPYIFDALVKGTEGTAYEKGTNIGLKLCKEFVTENGGKIWVESTENVGTTFYFSLKRA